MNNDHKAFWKWHKEDDGVVFELIFEGIRIGMCFYPNNDCGWWLIDKNNEEKFRLTEDVIPEDIIQKIKEVLSVEK